MNLFLFIKFSISVAFNWLISFLHMHFFRFCCRCCSCPISTTFLFSSLNFFSIFILSIISESHHTASTFLSVFIILFSIRHFFYHFIADMKGSTTFVYSINSFGSTQLPSAPKGTYIFICLFFHECFHQIYNFLHYFSLPVNIPRQNTNHFGKKKFERKNFKCRKHYNLSKNNRILRIVWVYPGIFNG